MFGEAAGPMLFVDHADGVALHLSALVVAPEGMELPDLEAGGQRASFAELARTRSHRVLRARFAAPMDRSSSYRALGQEFALAGGFGGDLRIAFTSCNGEEHGDLRRDRRERDAMWARLCAHHRDSAFGLLLHGGDQIYADEATRGHKLSAEWPERVPRDPDRSDLQDLRAHLRERFLERYLRHMRSPDFAWLVARVPSLCQWDDHDICDGWGSLPRSRTYSPVGQTIFETAREMALLFQHAAVDGDLPRRFHDPGGRHLGWWVDLPGLRIAAPDLRSERTRRQIMGKGGWAMMQALTDAAMPERMFLMSTVPLLGPRLSILEAVMVAIPKMQHYEDDLRDQWQSRAHRGEWRRMLRLLAGIARSKGVDVTALSGEIHLATRAEMSLGQGRVLHQLVASGIAHRPPPRSWARFLGLLSRLGEDPLPHRPIAIRRIPGQAQRYVAQRNALLLQRGAEGWIAQWDLEESGMSPGLPI